MINKVIKTMFDYRVMRSFIKRKNYKECLVAMRIKPLCWYIWRRLNRDLQMRLM